MTKADITHVVLMGDALGRMPQLQELGPGHLENQLLPDSDAHWRLSLIRADDVINRSPLAQFPVDASHVVISVEGNRAIAASGLLQGRPESYEQALARLSFAADQFEEVMRTLIDAALRTRLPVAVCTMFPPLYDDPVKQRAAATALAIFNDRIVLLALAARIPVIDLRTACSYPKDHSSEGLLSRVGVTKVAGLIRKALEQGSHGPDSTGIFSL